MQLTAIDILHTLIHETNMADSYEASDSNLQNLLSILRAVGRPKQSADSATSDGAKSDLNIRKPLANDYNHATRTQSLRLSADRLQLSGNAGSEIETMKTITSSSCIS